MRARTAAPGAALVVAALLSSGLVAGPATAGLLPPAHKAAAPATPAAGYGFTDGAGVLALSQADLDRELAAVAATGASWMRMPFSWSLIEATEGSYSWTDTDRVVRSARAHGLSVLGVVAYTPSWAHAGTDPTAPPSDPARFGAFAGLVASRYAGDVSSFEIWNEPNLGSFFGGTPDPVAYTALLEAADTAIKQVQPTATVVTGGLATGGTKAMTRSAFVTGLYAAGAAGSFDALGLHPYVMASGTHQDWTAMQTQIAQVHSLMLTNGDGAKQIWFTEFGSSTSVGVATQRQQADLAETQLAYAAHNPAVGVCILYSIRDSATNMADPTKSFGELLTYTWQPKKLAAELADR